MAKTSSKVATKIFGGLFHTKAGFFVILALIGLVFTAVEPEYLPNLFAHFFKGVVEPLITIVIVGYILRLGFKKITGH